MHPITHEDDLLALIASVTPTDAGWLPRAAARLDSLTKPPGSLGRLEELAARVACVQETVRPKAARKRIVLMAADHGVVAEGVSPYPQDVTMQMVENFAHGGAAINQLAATARAELTLVDIGVAGDLSELDGIVHAKLAQGTANFVQGPAMTRALCAEAILVGARLAQEAAADGVELIGTGEMGIGNTTAATALTCAFTGVAPLSVTGPGTGLDDAGIVRKAAVVGRALEVNAGLLTDPLGILAALGGLEIAGLAGVVIGAAASRRCVVVDGYISGAAALAALRICPGCADYVFPSHRSAEPGHAVVLVALGLEPVLDLDMRLGEGTGAALAFGIIEAACRMMSGMATFAEAGVSDADDARESALERGTGAAS
jgi:nicotinate-nucleotide--dimethylbenzimidazole phosphoribosyltransferase